VVSVSSVTAPEFSKLRTEISISGFSMPFRPHAALCCPLDCLPLEMHSGSLGCANHHSFDVARQGYVNLLGAQDKRSRDPGDSKAMIAARHRFLEAGYYQPIADGLGTSLLPHLQKNSLIVDAGCGEGYYLEQLRGRLLDSAQPEPCMVGFDISKWAMQTAGRRFAATWLVASNRNIPLAAASADVVMDMFGFADFAAFARLLKPSGLLVRVRAGENHLLELREIIYAEIKSRDTPAAGPLGFSCIGTARVNYEIARLGQTAIADLLLMTPHFFRASAPAKERVAALRELRLSVDVSIDLLQKNCA
jgi:23S rRNA (guanine745-N1)-methyltransferase